MRLTDPQIDVPIFLQAHHGGVTVFEVVAEDDALPSRVLGWRLLCPRCGLQGERLYQDIEQARGVAAILRAPIDGDETPPCGGEVH